MTPSSCSHPSRNLLPRRWPTPRAECFSILDQREGELCWGGSKADDEQILWAGQPSLHKSLCSRRLSSLSPFLAVYYCASGHHEWIKTKRGSEVARVDRGGGRRGCVRSRKRRGNDFLPPRRERYTTRMERNYPSWKILSSRLSRDEIDDWRASYLSGRLNISNGRNFRWMRTKFAK